MDMIAKVQETITAKIKALTADVTIETNEGTYSASEAVGATGSGDPAHNNYSVVESLDGTRRVIGCDPNIAPGYARKINAKQTASMRRAEIARLEAIAKRLKKHPSWEPMPADALAVIEM